MENAFFKKHSIIFISQDRWGYAVEKSGQLKVVEWPPAHPECLGRGMLSLSDINYSLVHRILISENQADHWRALSPAFPHF